MSSIGSNSPETRHIKLVQASAAGKEDVVRALINETQWTSQMDRDALRQALQRVAARGNISLTRFLIDNGAEVHPKKENEIAALIRAAECGHVKVVSILLQSGANTEAVDKFGRTALFLSTWKGYIEVAKTLLEAGANMNARDKDGRTVLIQVAEDRLFKYSETVCSLILENGAIVEARDNSRRTPLIWASATGKLEMVKLLLEGRDGKLYTRINIEAGNDRGRTALHFAAEGNHEAIVTLLLQHQANPRTTSDGGWTPLHNAAEKGHTRIVELLLEAGAPVNSELSNGMTSLHWAAQNGHHEVVQQLLNRPETRLAVKDSFDRTPMLCAAEQGFTDIVKLLSPGQNGGRLSAKARGACDQFLATVVDFGIEATQREKRQRVLKKTVFEALYGWDKHNDKPEVPSHVKNVKGKPTFRWIHIPANNLAWVEALLTKNFVEAGHRDIDGQKALEKCFNQEHRGPTVHASFMRTFCTRIPPMGLGRAAVEDEEKPKDPPPDPGPAAIPQINVQAATPMKGSLATLPSKEETPTKEAKEKKKSKAEKLAERHAKKGKGDTPTKQHTWGKGKGSGGEKSGGGGNPKDRRNSPARHSGPSGKIVLFMPFLHYESDENRDRMSRAIRRTYKSDPNDRSLDPPENPCPDDQLIEGYLNSTPALHARRTLDQFFYHGIDTSDRDQDQVVFRYCKRRGLKPQVFMVDQLWMWILSKELIITSFPQRWEQPGHDPLNVLAGIIEDMNAKTRSPVTSVYDLAMLITGRCSGMFDRHRLAEENYQFIDMFESSIGHVTHQETKLFDRFNRASGRATAYLKQHRVARLSRHFGLEQDPEFVDALLDIGVETKLLAEIKDIRDELSILGKVLENQLHVLPELAEYLGIEAGGKNSTEAIEIRKRSREQLKIIEVHLKDVERMDRQAELIYISLTHLLDLKQKHANAFEARFARDQANFTSRQGQTIMVFTLVTILFLPISFIAQYIQLLPTAADEPVSQRVAYISRYMFGIGIGISIILIILAFTVDEIARGSRKLWTKLTTKFSKAESEDDTPALEQAEWTRRPSQSQWSATEKWRTTLDGERPVSVNFHRDLSPLSDRTRLSAQGNHVGFVRTSYEIARERHLDGHTRPRGRSDAGSRTSHRYT